MALILILDVLVIVCLAAVASRKGLEETLPAAAFFLILFPNEAQLPLPGLFGLTTQRVIVATLCVLYFTSRRPDDDAKKRMPLGYLLILLAAWMALSTANSVVPVISLKTLLSQCFDFSVLYILCVRSISRMETVHKIFFALVTGMLVCSLLGILEARTGWQVSSLFPAMTGPPDLDAENYRGVRIQSAFPHPILFGAALAMTFPLAMYLLTRKNTTPRKVLLWTALWLMIYCLYKTGSRGPWMACILSLSLLGMLGRKPIRKIVAVVVVLSAAILVVRPAIWDTVAGLYQATTTDDSPQEQSYQWRYTLYHVARVELTKDIGRSLWGFGPESFSYLGLTTQFVVDGEEKTVPVESCDSAVVELMMDTGCIGFLLVAVILLKAMALSLRAYFSPPRQDDDFHLVVFVALAAFCFLMTNVELFGWGQQSYMLWILIALATSFPGAVAARAAAPARIAARAIPESA